MVHIGERLVGPDFNESLNALSEVVRNRPTPLRQFDQIFMKDEDMVAQAAFLAQKLSNRRTIFIGDGDSMALTMLHLWKRGLLRHGPRHLYVLDFDERIVNAINRFAKARGYQQHIAAELYNVAEPLPRRIIGRAQAFYTNPPWGASNDGNSVVAFVRCGIEALSSTGLAAIVVADDRELAWTMASSNVYERCFLRSVSS
jgi:N4-bis(aminopropyl)spermidine synthase